jgi:hypothetical protein
LQDPGWHRFRCEYPVPGTSNGDGFPAQVDPVLSYRSRRQTGSSHRARCSREHGV